MVIAIIAILAALLLPTLANAKNRAMRTVDLNNNKQILMGAHMYAADSNDYLPNAGWNVNLPSWAYAANIPNGGTSIAAYPTARNAQINNFFRKGQLAPPYIKTEKVMMCPMDNNVDAQFVRRGVLFTSYVWNGAVNGFGPMTRWAFKLSKFKPGRVLMWETDDRFPANLLQR